MSAIEKEVREATNVKPGKYNERKDYLAALIRAIQKLPDAAYDDMSDEAAKWYEAGITAMNKKRDVPDFPDVEVEEPAEEAEVEEAEADAEEAEGEDTESEDDAEEAESEEAAGDDAEAEAEDDPEEAEAEAEAEAEETSDDHDHEEAEAEEAKQANKKKSKKQPAKKVAVTKEPAKKVSDKAKPKAADKAATKAKPHPADRYANLSGEKDRYGITEGTQTSDAVKMYEKGTTAAELNAKLGGRYYNVLGKLKADGHKVEKLENGKWKVTHKDDLAGTKPKKK